MPRNSSLKMYRTWTRRILSYGTESRTTTSEGKISLDVFNSKIIRKLHIPIQKRKKKNKNKQRICDIKFTLSTVKRECKIYKIADINVAQTHWKGKKRKMTKQILTVRMKGTRKEEDNRKAGWVKLKRIWR